MAEASVSFTMGGVRYAVHGDAAACNLLAVKLTRLRMYEQECGEKFCEICRKPYRYKEDHTCGENP